MEFGAWNWGWEFGFWNLVLDFRFEVWIACFGLVLGLDLDFGA